MRLKKFRMPLALYLCYDKMPLAADHKRSGNIAAVPGGHLVLNDKTGIMRQKPFAQPVHNTVARSVFVHALSAGV